MIVTWDGGHFTAVSIRTSKVNPGPFKMQFGQKNRSRISEQVMEGVGEEFRLTQNSNKPQEQGNEKAGQPENQEAMVSARWRGRH